MLRLLSELFCHGLLPLFPREDVCSRGPIFVNPISNNWTPETCLSLETCMLAFWAIISSFRKFPEDCRVTAATNDSQPIWASYKRVHKPSSGLFSTRLVGSHAFSSLFCVYRTPSLLIESIAASVLYHAFACSAEFSGRL